MSTLAELPLENAVTVSDVMSACEVLLHAGFTAEGLSVLARLAGVDARALTDPDVREEYLAMIRRKRKKLMEEVRDGVHP